VIAAPISLKEIIPSIKENTMVVDFREDDKGDNFGNALNYISFESMLILSKRKKRETMNFEKLWKKSLLNLR
jgi:hypothetical protein